VQRSVERRKAEAILLSAGLDTSIVASAAAAAGHRPLAVTVCWDGGAPDYGYAADLAARLELKHHVVWAGEVELMAAMPAVIRVLRSFDPMELRNAVVQHVGLVAASADGARSCYVGDAADELFAGYSYMVRMAPEALAAYSRELAGFMRFSAGRLGAALGVEVVSPYLDQEIVDFAVELPPAQKVGDHLGERHGKWLLRLAFADDLPERFTWRTKTPAEYGSGSTRLREAALERLDEDAFQAVCQTAGAEGVHLRDREQAFYYRVFREAFPAPRSLDMGAPKRCPECAAPTPDSRSRYCAICGAYPI
jgi:asparagine synthase (glutamine-hydrolysing)